MSRLQERNGVRTSGVVISATFVLICGGLLFTQGMTNTLLLMAISFAMMLIAGVQWSKFLIVLGVYAVIAAGGWYVKSERAEDQSQEEVELSVEKGGQTIDRTGTQIGRLLAWWGDGTPKYEQKITSKNRQEMYSYMAQANGGLHGRIPGNSRETARLPLAFSDYIYAIVVEDWGLLGGIGRLLVYLWLVSRAGGIASRCTRAFPALLVMGMAVMVPAQALFHMAIVTGVFPVSGQPLPLISKGGSSIIATSIAFGIILSVSRYATGSSDSTKAVNAEMLQLPTEMTAQNPTQLQ